MKKLALALVASLAFLLPVSADAAPTHHSFSSHSNIDWD